MAPDDAYYEIETDLATNRLFMTFVGMLSEEQGRMAVTEIREAVTELEPGFDVVNDISDFKPVSQEATDAIEQGKRILATHGVSAVVRVVGDSVISKMQFDRVADEDETYHVATAESPEQAEEFLDRFREESDGPD